jgi:hypothetical protein
LKIINRSSTSNQGFATFLFGMVQYCTAINSSRADYQKVLQEITRRFEQENSKSEN